MDTLIALILISVVALAVVGLGVSSLIERMWGGPIEEAEAPVRLHHTARDYVNSDSAPLRVGVVSPQQDAVKENAETGKPAGPTPAELDRMIRAASDEAVARAVGRIAGLGYLQPGTRAKALLAVGIEGRRYTSLKPVIDAAQAAAQTERPEEPEPEPRAIKVYAGREGLEREIPMEPLP